jgi:hypothetical protein
MDSLVLFFKLKYLDKIIKSNIILSNKYIDYLLLNFSDNIISFPRFYWWEHIRNFTCLVKNREYFLIKWLWKVYYDVNLCENKVFKYISKWKDLKNTKYFFENSFSFNFYYGKNI